MAEEFNQGKAIAAYAHLMGLVSVGAYEERSAWHHEAGTWPEDGIEENIFNLEELAAQHGLEFVWHEEASTYTLEPMSEETRAAREAATKWTESDETMTEEKPTYQLTNTLITLSKAYSASLDERGILSIVGPACTQQFLPGEAYNLLAWLSDYHKERLYQLSHQAEQAESE